MIITCFKVTASPFQIGFTDPEEIGVITIIYEDSPDIPRRIIIHFGETVTVDDDLLRNAIKLVIRKGTIDSKDSKNTAALFDIEDGKVINPETVNEEISFILHQIPSYNDINCLGNNNFPPPPPGGSSCASI